MWATLLDRHPFPAVLVDQQGIICEQNILFDDASKRLSFIFSCEMGKLRIKDSGAQITLEKLLPLSNWPRGKVRQVIRVKADEHPPGHWLIVDRLRQRNELPHSDDTSPVAMVSLRVASERASFDIDILKDALDLTHSEAQLLIDLVNGSSIREIAHATNRRTSTLRWHLSNALRKTNCASQSELVRLVLLISL